MTTTTIEELIAKIADVDNQVAVLLKEREPIDRKLRRLDGKRKRLMDDLGRAMLEALSPDDRLAYLLSPESVDVSMEVYRERERVMRELGFTTGCIWSETRQPVLRVALTYGDPKSFERTLDGIRKTIKYYKPHADGWVRYGVFEHTLSEYGMYTLLVSPDGETACLTKTTYGRTEEKVKGTLPTVLKHIQEHHWYDGRKRSDD